MVEEVILDKCALWGAEQGTTRTVVADCVAVEDDLGGPLKVLYAILSVGNVGRQRFLELYLELLAAGKLLLVEWSNLNDTVALGNLHHVGTHELHAVAGTAPIETIGLAMHIAANKCIVIKALHNAQICSVNVDGIVHHALVQTVA